MLNNIKLKELSYKDINTIKKNIWLKNNKKCEILKKDLDYSNAVLDHIHKLKKEENSFNKGVIRGVIDRRVNVIEGKYKSIFNRFLSKEIRDCISLPEFLRNLADYLEKGGYSENNIMYVHPSEVKKEYLKKSSFNKLKKIYPKIEYPKSKKMTKKLDILFKKSNIEPEFY